MPPKSASASLPPFLRDIQPYDPWTPALRVGSIAWSWALLALWSYYCTDLQRWVIVTTVAHQGPRGENYAGLGGIVYLFPLLGSELGLFLAKCFVPYLAVATLLALLRRPVPLIIGVLCETVAVGFGTAIQVFVRGAAWPLWLFAFVVQASVAARLVHVMAERRELRLSLAATHSDEDTCASTQPN